MFNKDRHLPKAKLKNCQIVLSDTLKAGKNTSKDEFY
jgi:hypothetical protein